MRALRIGISLLLVFIAIPAFAAETATFDSDGVQIKYITAGEGEPVILIHGFIASAQLNWVAPGVFDALAQNFHVIAPDLRGHGGSGKPHGAENYGPKMAKDIINLMDHLKIQKAHIVGYSLGGFITVYIAAKYPDRVICAVPGGAGWSSPGDARANVSEDIAKSLEAGTGITPLIKALTPAGRPQPTQAELDQTNKMVLALNDPMALAGVARGLKDLQLTKEEVTKIKVPMRDVIGEIDPLKQTVDALKEVVPAVDVVVIKGADHMTAFRDPAFTPAVKEFIQAHSASKQTKDGAPAQKAPKGAPVASKSTAGAR